MSDVASAETLEQRRTAAVSCIQFALDLLKQGHAAEARALMDWAARWDLDVVQHFALQGPADIRLLAASIFTLHRPRGAEIGRPCAILGSAGTVLDPGKLPLIRAIFDHAQEGFDAGATPMPPLAGLYGGAAGTGMDDPTAGRSRPPRVFQVLARHINANPTYIESDIFFHFSRSAAQAELDTRAFEADPLLYDMPQRFPYTEEQIAEARRALDDALAAFRPDVLLFDGNFLPTDRTLDPSWLHAVRQAYGCRIVTVIADCYDAVENCYGAWVDASDLVVIFNAEATAPYLSGQFDKAFLACGLPFDEQLFVPAADGKTDIMALVGSNTRNRDDLVTVLKAHAVPITARLHQRLSGDAPDAHEYAALMRAALMTCNTGRVPGSRSLSLVTGRCFEAILAKTVLLEEVGSRLDDYFTPFVHYVPYANAHQLVMFSQFLLAHDDVRTRIAEQAHAWHRAHYTSDRFWGALLARLGLTRAAAPDPVPA